MILESLDDQRPLTLFTNELRCAVRLDDLTEAIWELVGLPPRARSGIWHLVGPEAVSRYTLGVLIAAWAGLDARRIMPGSSKDFDQPRPADLRLTTKATDAGLDTIMRPIGTLFTPSPQSRRRQRDPEG